jgi:DNA-binding SARP family transcriptional activator
LRVKYGMNISVPPRPQGSSSKGQSSVLARLRLIGQMEAWTLTSESVLPAGRKTRALLAIVALGAPRPVLRSRLAEMLWSRRSEEQARASLRQEIHRLLEALGPAGGDIISVNRDQLQLVPGAVWVDVEEVLRATPANPASLSLLDGDLLEDLDGVDSAFDAWLSVERERLRDHARTVAENLLREQSDPETAIPAAQQLLSIDRAHEGAWRALMRAHAARGERGMAIQTYERCRAVLADLLDAAPSPETQRLLSEIRNAKEMPQASVAAQPALPEARGAGHRGGARLGVMPLEMVGGSDEVAHLAPGLAEEITAALARFRWMFLVSSSSLARMAAQTRDETAIRRAFGLDFLLDGTVQLAGRRARITIRLLDLRAGNQVVWARRFDRQLNDILTLQDEIASEVVAQIDPEILLIEAKRAANRPPTDPTAYDLVLRALFLIDRFDREQFEEAGQLLVRAIALEPDYATAHALFAYWHVFLVGQNWADDNPAALEEAGRCAERAITLDPQDAKALTIAGHVRAFLHHRLREALVLHERALMVNPNLAMAWNLSGVTHAYLGDWEEAERRIDRYKTLSPMDPHAFFYDTAFIIVALIKRDYESAVVAGRQVSEINPSFSAACKPYIAALGHLGRRSEAEPVIRRLLVIEPDFTVQRFVETSPFAQEHDTLHYAEGLRLAGVPEGA